MTFHELIVHQGFRTVTALARASMGVAGTGGGIARTTINEYVIGHSRRWPVPAAYTDRE